MKTKTFFLVYLLLGFGLIQLSAQNSNSDGTYSLSWVETVGWMAPIYCGGVEIDRIVGVVESHSVQHWKNGVSQWKHYSMSGQGTSTQTDETFTFSEHVYLTDKGEEWGTCHTHLKGDKGTVYNISLILYTNGTWDVKNATCAGNDK
ncbi:MAG: hypothetical protein V2B15_14535 [Bacteroidota bacterium]